MLDTKKHYESGQFQYRSENHFLHRMKQYEKMKAEHDKMKNVKRTRQSEKQTAPGAKTDRKRIAGGSNPADRKAWAAALLKKLNRI